MTREQAGQPSGAQSMGKVDPPHRNAYGHTARLLHWITAAALAVTVPLGLAMTYRGNTLDIWDGATDTLYSTHKLIGFVLLWVVIARLIHRWRRPPPPAEPDMPRWRQAAATATHGALYALLIVVPLLGWAGVSLFPSLTLFGLFDLPAITAPDEARAKAVLALHGTLALLLAGLALVHLAAALEHHLIRRDGVLRRMWPSLRRD